MTINILEKEIEILNKEAKEILEYKNINKEDLIPNDIQDSIKIILSSNNIKEISKKTNNLDYLRNFKYTDLADLYENVKILESSLKTIRNHVDIEIFFKEGYQLDKNKLKEKLRKKKLYNEFPNINIEKIAELYKRPPKKIKTYYDDNLDILVDEFVFRKYLLAIIQMIFNEMDLLVCFVGPEGSGKSTKLTQDMLICYYILKEVGIIDYEFDIKEILFNSLEKFRTTEDKYFQNFFRIIGLDEGNELNRQDWKDPEVKTFFQRLRRERFNRRLKFLSLPVLGELIPNIILSRMNFIIDMKTKNEIMTGTLEKGEYDFFIIPRGNTIYSPFYKKELTRIDIKNKLYGNLKDKEYLKGMPRDIIIKRCHCNGVWGFKKELYIKELKESNKTFSVNKGIHFGLVELFMFYKSNVTLKKLNIGSKDIRYASMSKMINRINQFFYNDPDMLLKYQAMYDKKIADKEERELEN